MEMIISHINADFDAFASMVAAKKLYPQAEIVFPGSQEKKVREFIDSFHPVPFKRLRDIDLSSVKKVIIVDTKSADRLGTVSELMHRPELNVIIYDHHIHEEDDLHGTFEFIQEVGATATIFTEILKDKNIKPTPMEATILCLGIYEETGNFLFPTTTNRDLRAVAWLLKCGASLTIVSKYMKTELNPDEIDLLNELVHTAQDIVIGGLRILIAKASRDKYLGDAAHLAHRMMDMERTDAVFLILRMESKILIVGRSRAPEINVAEVLEEFGGGGHPTAASSTIKEMPIELVEDKLTSAVRSLTKPGKFAEDIMTRPVITTNIANTIKGAEEMMTRYGVNVLPIVDENVFKGIISREVVEKAIFHGFKKSKITDFMTTDAETAERFTPVGEVERTMIEKNQRFIPVVENGEIKGAITRTDILRSMYEDYLRKSGIKGGAAEERTTAKKNLASWLRNRFPAKLYDLLKLAGEIADSLDYNAYLIGGSVRDLLRGEDNFDMDIVIEGNGITFAKQMGTVLSAKVRSHERFGTAKIIKDDLKIDIATARTEYYESPAALPKVVMSSIKKDLYRRDFTINTLAIKLNADDFGKLVDFFGGQRDIKDKTIRVLYNLSFVEDPTRAFRAVRFAERFGFKISKHTENLMRSTVKMNLFEKLSGSRLFEELSLIFDEKEPATVIARLAEYDLLSVLNPRLELTEKIQSLLSSVQDALLWADLSFIEDPIDKRIIYLMAILSGLNDEDRISSLKRLSVPSRLTNTIVGNMRGAKEALRSLPLKDPASIYQALSHSNIETLLYVMASTEDERVKKEISGYLLEMRKIKTILTGDDLKRMGIEPGPIYSELLEKVLHEKLRGRLQNREEEKRYVLNYLKTTVGKS